MLLSLFLGENGKKVFAEFYLQVFAVRQYLQTSHSKLKHRQFSYWLHQWFCESENIISVWETVKSQENFAVGKTTNLVKYALLNNSIHVRHAKVVLWVI